MVWRSHQIVVATCLHEGREIPLGCGLDPDFCKLSIALHPEAFYFIADRRYCREIMLLFRNVGAMPKGADDVYSGHGGGGLIIA